MLEMELFSPYVGLGGTDTDEVEYHGGVLQLALSRCVILIGMNIQAYEVSRDYSVDFKMDQMDQTLIVVGSV